MTNLDKSYFNIIEKVESKRIISCQMNSSATPKSLLLCFFKPDEIEAWTDPYNSIPLKLMTILVYIIEILSSTVMLIFVTYETKGLFGHYRTVINQLLSFGYGAVSYEMIRRSDACFIT